jgi:hypothetical protein
MRTGWYRAWAILAVAGLSVTGFGQSSGATAKPAATFECPHGKRAPYTAEFKITTVQTLANGTTITRETSEVRALDAQKRTMTSTTSTQLHGDRTPLTTVMVQDQVAGTYTNWDSARKVATVQKQPRQDQRHGCWESDSGHTRWNFGPMPQRDASQQATAVARETSAAVRPATRESKTEDLGTAQIQGVEAHGHRTTTTTPAGRSATMSRWCAPMRSGMRPAWG